MKRGVFKRKKISLEKREPLVLLVTSVDFVESIKNFLWLNGRSLLGKGIQECSNFFLVAVSFLCSEIKVPYD